MQALFELNIVLIQQDPHFAALCVNKEGEDWEDPSDKRAMIAIKWFLMCAAERYAYYSYKFPGAD